jgi:hypothetical protein
MKKIAFGVVLFLAACIVQAANVTIDFEEYAGLGAAPLSFTSKSYTFTQTGDPTGVLDTLLGSTSFFFCPECAGNPSFRMEATNGALFDLTSMDLGFTEGVSFPTTVSGVFANNSTISLQLDSLGTWFDTISFDSSWSDLKSVSVTFDNTDNYFFNVPGVDNIVASVVPIPAAVWLFGSALAGLGWIRRRKTA